MSIFAKLYGIPREKRRQVIQELIEAVASRNGGTSREDVFGRHAAAAGDRPWSGA